MQALQLSGKSQFPYMVDSNTGTSMLESDSIINYLWQVGPPPPAHGVKSLVGIECCAGRVALQLTRAVQGGTSCFAWLGCAATWLPVAAGCLKRANFDELCHVHVARGQWRLQELQASVILLPHLQCSAAAMTACGRWGRPAAHRDQPAVI